LGKVLEWDPHNAVARQYWVLAKYYQYLTEGEQQLRDKQWDLARRSFRGALVVVPDDFAAKEYLLRGDELEKQELERQAEEERVSQKLVEARDLVKRASYRKAIDIYQEILKNHPERDDVKKALAEARRLLAAATKQPEVVVTPTAIPAEAVERYRAGSAALARGAVGDSIHTLEQLILDYPTYGDARSKLVDAYTYQGLDFYSKGSLSAALRSWRRALSYDPGNAKVQRYIKKAETEIDQIR
jgi:tetratricopeptide (TPR) repeat protein